MGFFISKKCLNHIENCGCNEFSYVADEMFFKQD